MSRFPDSLGFAALACVTLAVCFSAWATTRPRVVIRYRDVPPIEKGLPKRLVLRHFHLGRYTRAGYLSGEPAYEYVGPGWRVFFSFEQAGNPPPQGHSVRR